MSQFRLNVTVCTMFCTPSFFLEGPRDSVRISTNNKGAMEEVVIKVHFCQPKKYFKPYTMRRIDPNESPPFGMQA